MPISTAIPIRSDSMESRIPSNLGNYQNPRGTVEPIYSNCGGIEGGSDGQSGSEEHDWASDHGPSTSALKYQHPRSDS